MSQRHHQYPHIDEAPFGGYPSPNQGFGNHGAYQQHNAYANYVNEAPFGQQQQQLHPRYNHHPVNAQRSHQAAPTSMNQRPQHAAPQPASPNYNGYYAHHYGAPQQNQPQYYPQLMYQQQHNQAIYYQPQPQRPFGQPAQQQPQYMPQQPPMLTPQQITEQQQRQAATSQPRPTVQQARGPQQQHAEQLEDWLDPQPPVLPVRKEPAPVEQFPVLSPPRKPAVQQDRREPAISQQPQRPARRLEEPVGRSRDDNAQYNDYVPRSGRTLPNFPEFQMQYTHFQKRDDIQGEEAKNLINRSHLLITHDAELNDKHNKTNRTFVTFCKWNPLHVLDVSEIAIHEDKNCVDRHIIEQLKNL